jgi:hypothetical protein
MTVLLTGATTSLPPSFTKSIFAILERSLHSTGYSVLSAQLNATSTSYVVKGSVHFLASPAVAFFEVCIRF